MSTDIKDHCSLLNKILDFSEAQLVCSICSDIMNNPVAISCGHLFCSICIADWFKKSQKSCPCCRHPCPDGQQSEGIVAFHNYLRVLKPLLISRDKEQYRTIRRSLTCLEGEQKKNAKGSVEDPSSPSPGGAGDPSNPQGQGSKAYPSSLITDLLLSSLSTEKDSLSTEVALTLLKSAMSQTFFNDAAFLQDMDTFPFRPFSIISKYMCDPILTDPEIQYIPRRRRRCVTFHPPTTKSLIQISVLLIFAIMCYFLLEKLENEGFRLLCEPILRAIALLNVYGDLFSHLTT